MSAVGRPVGGGVGRGLTVPELAVRELAVRALAVRALAVRGLTVRELAVRVLPVRGLVVRAAAVRGPSARADRVMPPAGCARLRGPGPRRRAGCGRSRPHWVPHRRG
ncbi:hypothetical protein SAMN05661080_01837 [Modestobacter sp. DSM 44400]|nr:hypothetical protein SAMN05661080_01837 [Modestobacter sp. DSM 44400]